MVFAIITGLLYGRFSKPTMRILYSEKGLIAPYKNGWAFMFRVTNIRRSTLIELGANVSMSMVENIDGNKIRKYYRLPLEIKHIEFFPASWTIVHPIDESSQLKGFDQTYGQSVHSHYSYICNEIILGAKFKPAYSYDNDGTMLLPLDQFHEYELVEYNY